MPDDSPYSKREQDNFHDELMKRMDKQDVVLERIETQTTRTNGRVSKLEWWSGMFRWALSSLIIFVVVISPVLWYFIKLQIKQTTQDSAQKAVISALSQYNITVQQ